MSMSLTKDDLQAIKNIVENAAEDSKLQTAAGFAEVNEKFAEVHGKFAEVHERIDQLDDKLTKKIDKVDAKIEVKLNKLENTVRRLDQHDVEISKIKSKLSLA